MAKPIPWHGSNVLFQAPKEYQEQIGALPVYNNGKLTVSCWELTKEEIDDIVQTGCVYLMVFAGSRTPPVFLGNEDNCREVAADYGKIWKRLEDEVKLKDKK